MSGKNTTTLQAHARKVLAHQSQQTEASNGSDADAGPVPADPSFVAGLATGLRVKRRVTTPVLPFPEGTAILCQIIDAIHESQIEGDTRFGGAPASVCRIKAANGEERLLIVGAVLRKELDKNYPKAGYVGCWFHIAKLPRPDKAYSDYAITEIEPPESAAVAA